MKRLSLCLASLFLAHGASFAQVPNTGEARLRESLRATMLQLRTAETERATLQAAQATLEQKNQELAAQVSALAKQSAADKDASDKAIADLKARLTDREAEGTRLAQSLEKWKLSHQQAVELAQKKESDRATLAAEGIQLRRQVADQRTKNLAMHKLGLEILTRYEKFGLGTALAAREPFVGIARVKFENLIQDYSDQLSERRIKP